MTTTLLPAPVAAPTADPRLAAFCAQGSPEVFHSVATPVEMWKADPFDVDTIHAPAREAFERLLHRGSRVPAPPSGAVLALLGEAGSGKTHLMRAFRTRTHSQGLGYCGYMQMTTEVTSYPRYMLQNLIDGLEQPYAPAGPSRTGLARLSAALLEMVPGLGGAAAGAFRDGEGDPAKMADEYADLLASKQRFNFCDLELLRVMLHLQRDDPRVRNRALMWLRCQEMRPADRDWIGGAIPRADDSDPIRMLTALARLADAVHGVPLVLLVDQLEDMANLSAPVDRFRKVVDAVTALTDQVPNAVVVMACLEDYFKENQRHLTRAKLDRLSRDPEPVELAATRSLGEIKAMTACRLAHLYAEKGVDDDPAEPLFPFREAHLIPLQNLKTRDALNELRLHHLACIKAGRWVEPKSVTVDRGKLEPGKPTISEVTTGELDSLWNDSHAAFKAVVPDDEADLTAVLADAIRACSGELPDGVHFGDPRPDDRFLEVEMHKPGNAVDKLLVAVCNKRPQGGGLANQIAEVERRAGEIPVAIVRTTDFPGPTSQAAKQIGKMLKKDGRRVVVENADWRRMLAFEAFRKQHGFRPDFPTWQKAARPLGELKSLQDILRLRSLAALAAPVPPPKPIPERPTVAVSPPISPAAAITTAGNIRLGQTAGRLPTPVGFDPTEFTHHAAFLGGSGSGKTTAALNLIEQLLAQGIPAVLVDRKGDLCRYADPAAWDRPLAEPARDADRRALRAKLDVAVFTPGEPRGRPLALPVVPPGFADLPAHDREQFAQYAAAALGSMMGFRPAGQADNEQKAVLTKAIEVLAETPGAEVTVPALRELVGEQDPSLLAAVGGFDDRVYQKLADRLLTLWLNNRPLLTGDEALDIDALLGTGPHARPGRVRLSVVSTRFLPDPAKLDFWVAQLLVAVGRWCGKNPSARLQAVFLFDEADIYLPAGTRQPAAKAPMENLLKRARSAGVGVFLATQSPGDFDYRCKENVLTWLVGRVSQPQALEKLRPLFAAGRANPADKLAGQSAGEFYLVREGDVSAVRSDESFVRTEQVPEDRIAELARGGRPERPG